MEPIRTRFAPSPTGYLHIGGARTALLSWAYARRHGGKFILRIEDTDIVRSTPEAVQVIIDGMQWLGLSHDEGPHYQTQRMARYKEVIARMVEAGSAYHCFTAKEDLDRLRAEQEARKEKPRYDGRWRPEPGKTLPSPPTGVAPVVRFKNPLDGVVAWDDQVKGRIEIANAELDDFIIARADGTPTYNFCVVVDDWDMGITHVIRGDDHVSNTPRQINVLKALGARVPQYAHLPMILGDDGLKLSKRRNSVAVTDYAERGYLPEAVLNYLARLGWSHGDEEIFSMDQFVEWFDLDHITASAAQFDTGKLDWLNAHYIKHADNARLSAEVARRLVLRGIDTEAGPALDQAVALYKDRATNLNSLADAVEIFYLPIQPRSEKLVQGLAARARSALADFARGIAHIEWNASAINGLLSETVAAHGIRLGDLAMPVRLLVTGQTQTPAIDRVIALMARDRVVYSLERFLASAAV